ncbi:MAG: hypothetical protein ACRESI_04640 [Gammaproteobacteria bacterium]
MTSELCLRQSAGRLAPMRRARWFAWVLLAAVVCAVGVFTLGLSCDGDDSGAIPCAICQVTAHSVLEVYTPKFEAVMPVSLMHYFDIVAPKYSIPNHAFIIKNQSRAPPFA